MSDLEEKDKALREQLLYLLRGGGAHIHFEDVVKEFPAGLVNGRAEGLLETAWRVLEHMRITQRDILEFSRSAAHVSPEWPEGYWPADGAEAGEAAWRKSIEAFLTDREAMEALVADPATDLHAPIPHGDGQTVLREALLVADHNAYHLGVLVTLRRALGAKPGGGVGKQ